MTKMMEWLRELTLAKEDAAQSEARADHKFQKEGLLLLADTPGGGGSGVHAHEPLRSFHQRYFYIRGGFLCCLDSPVCYCV